MWDQCGISCIKSEQFFRGNVLSLKALSAVASLIFIDSPLTHQTAHYILQHSSEMTLFGMWEPDNEASDTVVDFGQNSEIPNISKCVYMKNETNCSYRLCGVTQPPFEFGTLRGNINKIIMMVTQPKGVFCS